MHRRTALKLMALGLGTSMTELANAQSIIDRQRVGELAVSKGNTEFATDLYSKLRDKDGSNT
jgi:hypothetical protein